MRINTASNFEIADSSDSRSIANQQGTVLPAANETLGSSEFTELPSTAAARGKPWEGEGQRQFISSRLRPSSYYLPPSREGRRHSRQQSRVCSAQQ